MPSEIYQTAAMLETEGADEQGRYQVTIAVNDEIGPGDPGLDLRTMDLTRYMSNPAVLWGHAQWELPIGRTLFLDRAETGSIRAYFEFLEDDEMAARVKNAWDKGFLRAASIGWKSKGERPGVYKKDEEESKVRDAELIEWSIVSIGADKDALRTQHRGLYDDIYVNLPSVSGRAASGQPGHQAPDPNPPTKEDRMNKEDLAAIQEIVQREVADHKGKPDQITAKVVESITERWDASQETRRAEVQAQVDEALAQRDAQKKIADEERAAKEKAETERKAAEAQVKADALKRAELIVQCRDLIPKDQDIGSMSERDMMIAALGKFVDDVENRSDDYLRASLDYMIKERQQAQISGWKAADPTTGEIYLPPTGSTPSGAFGVNRNQNFTNMILDDIQSGERNFNAWESKQRN